MDVINNYKDTTKLVFTDKILDNVHGFIHFTNAESQIMQLLLFKRLQNIKQLSLVNWVFPGSEHTRFIHSLGVMHIADKIAVQLNLSVEQRKIIRLAGLLHDIGHFPLSHVGESPYKNYDDNLSDNEFCINENKRIVKKIEGYKLDIELDLMEVSRKGHHEYIGAQVIKKNKQIRGIIESECAIDNVVEIICDIITGDVRPDYKEHWILVQILHSELDADGIDYMLRDAVFSGTSFGSFEVEQLIGSMEIGDFAGNQILCINNKGIAAADQYIINKFFSYSQVVFNKHSSILEWMAKKVVSWMSSEGVFFPSVHKLTNDWIEDLEDESRDCDFVKFTDGYFWAKIKDVLENEGVSAPPKYIREICERLINHQELEYIEDSEVKVVSDDSAAIRAMLKDSKFYKHYLNENDSITILSTRRMSRHVPLASFESEIPESDESYEIYNNLMNEEEQLQSTEKYNHKYSSTIGARLNKFTQDEVEDSTYHLNRLMHGICVKEMDKLHLLCDDPRSLMQSMYSIELVILRSYRFCVPK